MKKTWKPIAAGVLCIVLGSMWIFVAISVAFTAFSGKNQATVIIGLISVSPCIIFGLIALCGGIFLCIRKKWRLGVVGSSCGVLSVMIIWAYILSDCLQHPAAFASYGTLFIIAAVPLILSISALILAVLSKTEFVHSVKPDLSAPS